MRMRFGLQQNIREGSDSETKADSCLHFGSVRLSPQLRPGAPLSAPPPPTPAQSPQQSLTFSFDLIHADGILGVERPDLAGRQRVSSLDTGRHRVRWRLHELDERLRACNRHGAAALPQNFSSLSVHAPHQNHFGRNLPAHTENVMPAFPKALWFSSSFTFELSAGHDGRSQMWWIITDYVRSDHKVKHLAFLLTFNTHHLHF